MKLLTSLGALLFLVGLNISGADALDEDIIGITVASCISLFFLSLVITAIVVSFSWRNWYNTWMRRKGKVRMPKEYFEKKKEVRRRLLASARTSVRSARSSQRSQPPLPVPPVGAAHNGVDRASWVNGWNQNSTPRGLETLDATMVLGDEKDEEYKIETVLVDNEVLDVGPYKNDHSKEQPVKGDVYPVPYIFKVGDKANGSAPQEVTTRSTRSTEGEVTHVSVTSNTHEMIEVPDPYNYSTIGEVKRSNNDSVIML